MATTTQVDKPPDLRGIVESLRSSLNTAKRVGAALDAEGMMASRLVQRWKDNARKSSQFPGGHAERASVVMRELQSFRLRAALTSMVKPEDAHEERERIGPHSSLLKPPENPPPAPQGSEVSPSFHETVEKPIEPEQENEQRSQDLAAAKAEVYKEFERAQAEVAQRMEELRREREMTEMKHAEWLAASQRVVDEARVKAEEEVEKIREATETAKEELVASVARAEEQAELVKPTIEEDKSTTETPEAPRATDKNLEKEAVEETTVIVALDSTEEKKVEEKDVDKEEEEEEKDSPPKAPLTLRDSVSSFQRRSNDGSSEESERSTHEKETMRQYVTTETDLPRGDSEVWAWDDSLIIVNPPQLDEECSDKDEEEADEEDGEKVDEEGKDNEEVVEVPSMMELRHRRWKPSKRMIQTVGFILRDRLLLQVIVMGVVTFAMPGKRKKSAYLQTASPRILVEVFSP